MTKKIEILLEKLLTEYNIYGDEPDNLKSLGYLLISFSILYITGYFFTEGSPIFIVPLILNIAFFLYTFYVYLNMKSDFKLNTPIEIALAFFFSLNVIVNVFLSVLFFGTIIMLLIFLIITILSYSKIMLFLTPIVITCGIIILLNKKENSNV